MTVLYRCFDDTLTVLLRSFDRTLTLLWRNFNVDKNKNVPLTQLWRSFDGTKTFDFQKLTLLHCAIASLNDGPLTFLWRDVDGTGTLTEQKNVKSFSLRQRNVSGLSHFFIDVPLTQLSVKGALWIHIYHFPSGKPVPLDPTHISNWDAFATGMHSRFSHVPWTTREGEFLYIPQTQFTRNAPVN